MEGLCKKCRFLALPRFWKVFLVFFYCILLPIYLYIGFQPSLPADAASFPELSIAGIDLTTPVQPLELIDHELPTPAIIAGSYSQNDNKTLIIGHSSTVFTNLPELSLNQIVTYDHRDYVITDISTLPKSEISMKSILSAADVDTIILMTCAGESLPGQDATHRLIITAVIAN